MIRNHKFFIIILVSVLLLISLSTFSNAGMDYTVTQSDIAFGESVANGSDFIILTDTGHVYLLVCAEGTSRVYLENNVLKNSSNSFFLYMKSGETWNSSGSNSSYNLAQNFSYWYSSISIHNGSTGTDVFFWQTQMNLKGVLMRVIMKSLIILVPVGLTILSIFLLVYLIASKRWLKL